ncbi:MAG: [glutamine synthetase] adenylyltransferase / [glutamine synthetase]-adenylyl-L-tyrosine [Candidatus Binatota bacterium]|nr:[glutamine synthetase] adenylyltransferase / [glutamine synthetase]-adenylyl-L-tyrosine [Candidatus Binatota bacterium]
MTTAARESARLSGVPDPERVERLLRRLEGWLRARSIERMVEESLSAVADPAMALGHLEELIAGGREPPADLVVPLMRVLGGSQVLARTLLTTEKTGLASFEGALAIDRVTREEHVEALEQATPAPAEDAAPALRRYKRMQILRIGARDLLRVASVEETVREVSSLAEGMIEAAYRHARARVAREFGELDDFRFAVLAMGKLGGGELNFSSDVDLIYLYEGGGAGSRGGPKGGVDAQAYAARLSEYLTKLLAERTDEGFVFRVDLRLRPDGQSGPIVNSVAGALAYYEAFGQTWERAAMLKARPIAGDLGLGARFLEEMRPFVYRRYLDFETVEEIQAMKRRVREAHSPERLERDVKLGPGGIREVEFIVQVHQLVHGGRDERLRDRSTLRALEALAATGVLDAAEANELAGAYLFLRDVEHKLQIVDERQTQILPADAHEERLLARRMGYAAVRNDGPPVDAPELARFRCDLSEHRGAVRRAFEQLFSGADNAAAGDEIWPLGQPGDGQSLSGRLSSIGVRDPEAAAASLHAILDPPSATPRRRRALAAVVPSLMTAIGASSDPDAALRNMAAFVAGVGARTSFLALLRENPQTLRLLVGLFGSSQYLSNFFIRHPELLDSLVRADLAAVRKDVATLSRHLSSHLDAAADYEARLDALRRFRNEEFLRIGVNDIHGLLTLAEVGEELTDLAEACLGAALAIAEQAVSERWVPPPGRFAILGMGKLGGRELTYSSDLDLIFVYDGTAAEGAISFHEYFTRMAQRLMSVLQLTTREGSVYKIDTRLRPSGSAGPLCSSLDAFRGYHATSSEVWERQALIRARGVAGDRSLLDQVEGIVDEFVYGSGLSETDAGEIARLRARMEKELAGESAERWNLKTGRGGIVDVEFLTQMLQLRHGREHPSVRQRATEPALEALAAAGLLPAAEFHDLLDGYRFLRRLESRLRLESDQPVEALEHHGPAVESVARGLGYSGAADSAARVLLADFEAVRERVRRVYERHLGAEN